MAEAAVVEGEEAEAEWRAGPGEGGDAVGEGAAGVVEVEDRCVCYGSWWGLEDRRECTSRRGGGWPASVDVEVDFFEGHAGGGGGGGDGAGGVEEQLPLALVEEEAEGGVSAEGGGRRRVRAKAVRSQRGADGRGVGPGSGS
jgi:hypothetical protein